MKRKFQHPEPAEPSGRKYWRSLDELADTPGFREQLAREFPQGAAELEGSDRRQFLKLMAASFALGGIGLAGCRRPERNILPFGKSVEGIIPGLPQYYATAMPLRKSAIPLLAETHQGRPTKLEGNPSFKDRPGVADHGGAASLQAQASVLDLYDPDRATAHTKGGKTIDAAAVNELLANLNRNYAATRGTGLAFLAEESSSPTRARLVARLRAALPNAVWAEYEPVSDEADAAATRAAFGRDVKPLYRFANAKRIVSLDADFLQGEAGSLYYARSFTNGRRVAKKDDPMNRLYVAESGFTLTGSMADHRLRLASSHIFAFAAALAQKLTNNGELAPYAAGLEFKDKDNWIAECAADLLLHRGSSLVVAGAHQPAQVHAIAHGLNAFLGNIGKTVDIVDVPASTAVSISQLATSIKNNAVKTLVILGGNPVYNAPADLEFEGLLAKVPDVVRYGYYADETSAKSGAHIAAAHYLESWGDARTVDGTVVPIQPMILPLFGGLTDIEVLARIAGEVETDPYQLVSTTITALAGGVAPMQRFLHDGLLQGSAYRTANVTFNVGAVRALFANTPKLENLSKTSLEVRFVRDHKMDDGRFANNGWLQECPDPITKISWDNAILISPRLAKELGIESHGSKLQITRKEENDFFIGKENARVFELTVGGRKIRGPVHTQPGLSNYTVVVPLGYGRTATGHVGNGAGFSAYPLRTTAAMHTATGGSLTDTGVRVLLANTQEHWSMEGRDIVREGTYEDGGKSNDLAFANGFGLETHSPAVYGDLTPEEVSKLPEEKRKEIAAARSHEVPRGNSLYTTPKFDGYHQWGMSIDLNTCIGCNACVVACQAENNIPIVGKDQVLRGREMHWIRIDRYYSDGRADAAAFGGEGNREIPEDPQVSLQPMTCVHCEMAPCETVCPVNATVHDDEGLNTMAYNRCIGTRYCANNCPYKVRRFNFFDFNQRHLDSLYLSQLGPKGMPELVKMVKNPEVTVRMRGVMEKCTYCVQRIQNGKIQHKVKMAKAGTPEKVVVPDGTIKTACQQTCPVDAIVFGNILDLDSALMKAKGREQDYAVLGYLNTRPRTTYSAKLRNPNPKMPDYQSLPFSRQEYERKNNPLHGAHGGESHEGAGEHAPAHEEKKDVMLDAAKRLGGLS